MSCVFRMNNKLRLRLSLRLRLRLQNEQQPNEQAQPQTQPQPQLSAATKRTALVKVTTAKISECLTKMKIEVLLEVQLGFCGIFGRVLVNRRRFHEGNPPELPEVDEVRRAIEGNCLRNLMMVWSSFAKKRRFAIELELSLRRFSKVRFLVKPVSVRPILEIGHDALLEPMTVVDLLKA
ncbi:unnamed protein product [Brassica oleracea var. botrytis]|uniref:Uncharacterized protein n=3 Tax=Brassica TaxID=3705 RepID=A0A0D3CYZ4_BRAOL|nr:unnamed protein product [Brassica napus]VDD63828.1 unnamed protein product [Brassica oleracea]